MRRLFPLLILLAGCGGLPAERSIRIDLPAPSAARPLAESGLSLRLIRFTARGDLQERNLAYVEPGSPTDVRQAATIVWEEPPETAASAYLAAALKGAGANVIANGIPGTPNYILSGMVQRFELVGGATGTATVALDVSVSDAKDGDPWLAASYCARAAATDRGLPSVQTAFQAALAEIAGHLVTDMAARKGGAAVMPPVPRGSRLAPC